jgi:hypothetical protein
MNWFVKVVIYATVTVWAMVLLFTGQQVSSELLHPLSTVTSVVVLLGIAFELWLWKLRFLRGWLVKRPVIDGSWRTEIRSNYKAADGETIPPIVGFMVIRQTFLSLSMRLLTEESSSDLLATEIVCSVDGLYCVSGVYRNESRYRVRDRSPIHYGAVWLQVIETPTQMLEGHYWTDRNTAGELRLTERKGKRFQDFRSVQAHFSQ